MAKTICFPDRHLHFMCDLQIWNGLYHKEKFIVALVRLAVIQSCNITNIADEIVNMLCLKSNKNYLWPYEVVL